MRLIGVIISLLCANLVLAVERHDFAYGYSLEIDGDGAIYSLYLTKDIYAGLTRRDRGDLRVLNSHDISVPHYIRRPKQIKEQLVEDESVAFFPLYKTNVVGQNVNKNVHITTNDNGAIIDINYGKTAQLQDQLTGYIIDASHLKELPAASTLHVYWSPLQENFVIPVKVEGSQDLNQWQLITNKYNVSHLQYLDHTLLQREVGLSDKKYKYFRLTWTGTKPLLIEKLVLRFPQSLSTRPREWSTFLPESYDAKNRTYLYKTNSILPVDRIQVNLPQNNTLVRARIESAASPKGPWYHRFNGLLYQLQHDGNVVNNPIAKLAFNTHTFWRIQLLNNANQLGGEPSLQLGWVPEELLFVAQGEGPFTLVYGNANVVSAYTPLPQLLNRNDKHDNLIKVAHLGTKFELSPNPQLFPSQPTDWKRYSIWAILILGVLLLAWMALGLYKQMNSVDNDGS